MNITQDTQDRIKRLLPFHLKLSNDGDRFKTLYSLFYSNPVNDQEGIQFLQQKKMIDLENNILPRGLTVILSNEFGVNAISIMLLSKVYVFQAFAPSDTCFPKITLQRLFSNFVSKETINARVTDLRSKNLVISPGHNQLRIPLDSFVNLTKFQKSIISISDYFDSRNDMAETLITKDPNIQQNISQNQKLLSDMENN